MKYSEIKDFLKTLSSPVEKLDFVMDLGNSLSTPESDDNCYNISGCSSNVEICIGRKNISAKADSKLISGVLVILLSIVDEYRQDNKYKKILKSEFSSLNLEFGIGRVSGINSIISFLESLSF